MPLLFHLEHDPSELHDVAHRYPEVVAELVAEAERLQGATSLPRGRLRSTETRATTVANSGVIVQFGRELGPNHSQSGRPITSRK